LKKAKRPSRHNKLSKRSEVIEDMLQKMLKQNSEQSVQGQTLEPPPSYRQTVMSDGESDDDNDILSIFANGQISPSQNSDIDDVSLTATEEDVTLSDVHKKCLYDMFGEDAVVKSPYKKEGLVLDKSQIEVLENSYRAKKSNYLSAFSEENFDCFVFCAWTPHPQAFAMDALSIVWQKMFVYAFPPNTVNS